MPNYNPSNWYWIVDGSTSQVYSSASDSYVATTDSTYEAWLAAGNVPTKIIGNDMLDWRIKRLEAGVSDRMVQEAVTSSSNTFSSGSYNGMTSAQALAAIRSAIDSLREQKS